MRTPKTSGDQTKCVFIRVVVNDLQKYNRHNFMKLSNQIFLDIRKFKVASLGAKVDETIGD